MTTASEKDDPKFGPSGCPEVLLIVFLQILFIRSDILKMELLKLQGLFKMFKGLLIPEMSIEQIAMGRKYLCPV
jgi:hypothetical protein